MYIYIIMEDVLIFVAIGNVHLFQYVLSHNYLSPAMVTRIIMADDITLIQSIQHMALYLNISRKLDVTRFMLIWGKIQHPNDYIWHIFDKNISTHLPPKYCCYSFLFIIIIVIIYYHHHHYNYCCYLSMLFLLLLSSLLIVIFFIIIIMIIILMF